MSEFQNTDVALSVDCIHIVVIVEVVARFRLIDQLAQHFNDFLVASFLSLVILGFQLGEALKCCVRNFNHLLGILNQGTLEGAAFACDVREAVVNAVVETPDAFISQITHWW